jgi:hypothetical protein
MHDDKRRFFHSKYILVSMYVHFTAPSHGSARTLAEVHECVATPVHRKEPLARAARARGGGAALGRGRRRHLCTLEVLVTSHWKHPTGPRAAYSFHQEQLGRSTLKRTLSLIFRPCGPMTGPTIMAKAKVMRMLVQAISAAHLKSPGVRCGEGLLRGLFGFSCRSG